MKAIWVGFAAAILALVAISLAAAGPQPAQAGVDFAAHSAIIDLKNNLQPYDAAAGQENDGSRWYLLTAANQSTRAATRVLVAAEPADVSLHLLPRRGRPQILQVASSDSAITVERIGAFAKHAYRVTIPPASSAALAIRLAYADDPPSVLAWTEGALVTHNRQLALFLAGVAGLIAAAFAIMAGVATVTAHPAPAWAAAILGCLLLLRLQTAGGLDAGWMTYAGGPYGLSAMLAGLTLAAGFRLADLVAPLAERWPVPKGWEKWIWRVLLALSFAAFVGVPGATVLLEAAVVIGTGAIAAYLVHCGLQRSAAARVLAPSAAIFALVAAASAALAFGSGFQIPMASSAVGGFVAAGAVLLALAVAAGEGIAILPLAARHGSVSAPGPREAPHNSTLNTSEPVRDSAASAEASALKAIGAAYQGIFDLDFETGKLLLSAEAASLVGLKGVAPISHEAWIGRVHPEDREVYVDALEDYRSQPGLAFRIEFRAQKGKGGYPWLELRATILGEGASGRRCLGLIADVTGRRVSEPVRIDRSLRDPLTGLGNRISLVQDLESLGKEWARAILAILDLDRFKAIHASLGDAGADEVLIGIASRLSKRFLKIAKVYRIGGDSFAALSLQADELSASLGAKMVETGATPVSVAGRRIFPSGSVGIAAGRDAEDPLKLIRNAEIALAAAKRQGGGCSKLFVAGMEEAAQADAVALETDLRRALALNQFDLFYQPIVRLSDEVVAGFEALLRWRRADGSIVLPAEFIPHCERTGLIVALGRFALERATSDLADWQRRFPADPPLFASINVSRRQLREAAFVSGVRRLLDSNRLARGALTLEITESAIDGEQDAAQTLLQLREAGTGLALDDFGTGLSSLSQLQELPFDTIKIDRSFLARAGAAQDPEKSKILSSMIALAHELKKSVVVEGVESQAGAAWLRSLGCEYAQGFYFASPMARADVPEYIAAQAKPAVSAGQSEDMEGAIAQARPA